MLNQREWKGIHVMPVMLHLFRFEFVFTSVRTFVATLIITGYMDCLDARRVITTNEVNGGHIAEEVIERHFIGVAIIVLCIDTNRRNADPFGTDSHKLSQRFLTIDLHFLEEFERIIRVPIDDIHPLLWGRRDVRASPHPLWSSRSTVCSVSRSSGRVTPPDRCPQLAALRCIVSFATSARRRRPTRRM